MGWSRRNQQWQRVQGSSVIKHNNGNNDYQCNGPTTVLSWSEWHYSDWSEWDVIGWVGNGQKTADADVDMSFDNSVRRFFRNEFRYYRHNEESTQEQKSDYPSFTTEATSFSNKRYYVVRKI